VGNKICLKANFKNDLTKVIFNYFMYKFTFHYLSLNILWKLGSHLLNNIRNCSL